VLSRPTTDQVLEGVVGDLRALVLPKLEDEPARVAVGMMEQLVRGAALRAAHEIAWMHEEMAEIQHAAFVVTDDAAVAAAMAAFEELDATSLHLEDVVARYSAAGEVLSCAVEAAYRRGDDAAIGALRDVLQRRSDREMQIIGSLDLVGRG
jgi:hypothetical protein